MTSRHSLVVVSGSGRTLQFERSDDKSLEPTSSQMVGARMGENQRQLQLSLADTDVDASSGLLTRLLLRP